MHFPVLLAGVLGMLDLLRLTPVSSEQGRYLRAMQGSAESLLTIINDILVSLTGAPWRSARCAGSNLKRSP